MSSNLQQYCWTAIIACGLIPSMQTLGLSDSTPRTESRLKSLFWPSIETGNDVDYLGLQGCWVCTVIATVSFFFLARVNLITAAIVFFLFYLSGVGVRERSSYAATIVFAMFLLDTVPVIVRAGLSGAIVLRVLFLALLFSNARATWTASRWQADSEEAALPPRLGETWGDKFADKLPMWLWPKIRYLYYVFSACLLVLSIVGMLIRHSR
jgi:hypothetical protein